ncbi:MAG TPA: putative glycoside hydrolase, partial [Sphingomonas sp.]
LPLRPTANILVAGKGADSIAQAAGGWSITWQGTDVANKSFPNAQSIWSGIDETVRAAGGRATLSPDGAFTAKPDAAIVVFGETPYAEFVGDRPNLEYSPDDKSDLALLRKFKAAGVPVVAVFLSGRPLWVNAEINASDAFVAAFLPGSEGGGVADLLFADKNGRPAHDFRGKLSFSWPKRPDQFALNRRDPGYDPLFPFGYGLRHADKVTLGLLDETRPAGLDMGASGPLFAKGRVQDGWSIALSEPGGPVVRALGAALATTQGRLTMRGIDRDTQEDARRFAWNGTGRAEVRFESPRPLDIGREANGELSLVVQYRVDVAPSAAVTLGVVSGTGKRSDVAVTAPINAAGIGNWRTLAVPLKCFVAAGADPARVTTPFVLATAGRLTLSVSDVSIARADVPMDRCDQP